MNTSIKMADHFQIDLLMSYISLCMLSELQKPKDLFTMLTSDSILTYIPANTERSPNIPEWSHEVIFLGTKQERYRNVPCRLFLGSIFIT